MFKVQELLGGARKATTVTKKGVPVNSGFVECKSDVFKAIFGEFNLSKQRGKTQRCGVKFTGLEGIRSLEGIFGKEFWKFSFDNGDYNYIQFRDNFGAKKDYDIVLNHGTKKLRNCFPKANLGEERLYFNFRRT